MIRDEAHSFAIVGHRQQRDKQRVVRLLEQIRRNQGAKRRKHCTAALVAARN